MKKKIKKENKNFNQEEGWIKFLKEWATESLKKVALNTFEEARQRVELFFRKLLGNISRLVISSLVILIGLVFLMVGLAVLINELLPISGGIGYIIVGLIVALAGIIISDHSRK
jgi:hypothetical protein